MSLYAFPINNQKTQFQIASAKKKFNGLGRRQFKDFQMDVCVYKNQVAPHKTLGFLVSPFCYTHGEL